MADVTALLPQILVYGLLLFAAVILIYKVRNFLNGKTSCSSCSGCGCSSSESSGSACCRSKSSDSDFKKDKKESDLNVIEIRK